MLCEVFNISSQNMDYIGRLLAAAALAGVIGIEREFHGRAAGFRTNVLVGTGAALFMILSQVVAMQGKILTEVGVGVPDPGRIAAQIVTGIGFLGAGTIIKSGINVRGLTTAACLWIVASIGMACGAAEYSLGIMVTVITVLCLFVFSFFGKIIPHHSYRSLLLKTDLDVNTNRIIDLLKDVVTVQNIDFERNYTTNENVIVLSIRIFRAAKTDKLFKLVSQTLSDEIEGIRVIKWTRK